MSKKKLRKRIRVLEPAARAWYAWNNHTLDEQIRILQARKGTFPGAFHDETVLAQRAMRADFNRAAYHG